MRKHVASFLEIMKELKKNSSRNLITEFIDLDNDNFHRQ